MEDCGCKNVHKLPIFVRKLDSRKICLINFKLKDFKNSNIFSNIYRKPVREYRKPKFSLDGRARISKFCFPFSEEIQLTKYVRNFRKCFDFYQKNHLQTD